MDDAGARATFYAGLPQEYAKNSGGFFCDGEEAKVKHLKKLREALQTNVLEKLRNCRDQDVPLLLRWFRTCQYEQENEDKELYLCPKYAPCCETAGVVRLEYLGPDMYAKTGELTDAEIAELVDECVAGKSKSGTAGKTTMTKSSSTTAFDIQFTKSVSTIPKDADVEKLINFVLHHKRVFDVTKDANKMKRIKAQMGSLRAIDYSFLLPDCVISPEFSWLGKAGVSAAALSYNNVVDANAVTNAKTAIDAAIGAALTAKQISAATKTAMDTRNAELLKDVNAKLTAKNRDGALTILKAMLNPAAHPVPMVMMEQICHTGLYSRQLFMSEVTGSGKLARACRALAAGCHKNCPAANGHLPEAYPLGTVAPGVKGSHSFWVNAVVQRSVFLDGDDKGTVVSKCEWVPAPAMMVSTLTTLKKMEEQMHKLVVKEYMCLKQKEGIAERPPCSELDTFNTNAAIVALRSATERLQSKGLSAQQCIGLLGEFDEPRMSRSRKSSRRRKQKSRSRK